jgi:chromosome segregation ATPase
MLAEMRPSAGASMERAVEGGEDTLAQIDRLKEALRRLQTVSSREIQELKEKVESLSASNYAANLRLRELEHVELKCVSLAAELSVSQSEVRDLSQMVDAASASEELVERLTNENFSLGQQLVQLKTVVSDLEASAELSEELDASQRAEIVALRRDIELKDLHISNMLIEGKNARARLDESNRMIEKLRSTVASLQDSLRSLQAEASAVLDDNKNEAAVRAKQRLMRLNQSNLVLFQNCAELNGKLICLNSSVIECKSRIECLEAVLPTSLERDSSIQSRIAMLIRFQSVDANIRSAQGVCVASLSMLRRLLDVFGLKFCSSIFDSLSDVIDSSHNPLMVMTSKNFQSDSTSAIKKVFSVCPKLDIFYTHNICCYRCLSCGYISILCGAFSCAFELTRLPAF